VVELSVVIPVYGCDGCLRALHSRLRATLDELTDSSEIVFVDDRSPDDSWRTLLELAAEDPGVRAIRLSRNFGQHHAITAGISEARGRWLAVMDCDLQDEPEQLGRLYEKALEGHDIVLARRTRRRGPWARRVAGRSYYGVRNRLVGADMYTNYTNLSVISRKVAEAFLALRDRDRQYLLILHWLGFDRAEIEVEPAERHAGRSAYSWRALLRVALDGMFFQSTVLLRWIVYAGFVLAAAGVALALYTLIVYAFGRELPDWTGLPVLILLLTGFIICSTGVTALYVGKIFEQVKGRPLYVVDTKVSDGVERTVRRELAATPPVEERAVVDPSPPPVDPTRP
jgi:glycosyltransferase involved in cell wall biosynthesis